MSRSGYSEELDQWDLIRWRGQVASAIRGKRGQAFLRAMLAALSLLCFAAGFAIAFTHGLHVVRAPRPSLWAVLRVTAMVAACFTAGVLILVWPQ